MNSLNERHRAWLESLGGLLQVENPDTAEHVRLRGEKIAELIQGSPDLNDPDLHAVADFLPLGNLSSMQMGTRFLDLGSLLRCWAIGHLRSDCGDCGAVDALRVYSVTASSLSRRFFRSF